MTVITVPIAADIDDGDEVNGVTWRPRTTGTVALAAGYQNSTFTFRFGFRFTGVNVPQGATINSATITVDVTTIQNTPDLTVFGDDVDNAPAWGASSRPSQTTHTAASADFDGGITATGAHAVGVTAIVQELVSRTGWSSGNAMRFAVDNNATGADYQALFINDYPNGTITKLTVNFTAAGGGALPLIRRRRELM